MKFVKLPDSCGPSVKVQAVPPGSHLTALTSLHSSLNSSHSAQSRTLWTRVDGGVGLVGEEEPQAVKANAPALFD